jgi:hypothetical protein
MAPANGKSQLKAGVEIGVCLIMIFMEAHPHLLRDVVNHATLKQPTPPTRSNMGNCVVRQQIEQRTNAPHAHVPPLVTIFRRSQRVRHGV